MSQVTHFTPAFADILDASAELATHETEENYRKSEAHLGRFFITLGDWHTRPRLGVAAFRAMRLTLTQYENTSWLAARLPHGSCQGRIDECVASQG